MFASFAWSPWWVLLIAVAIALAVILFTKARFTGLLLLALVVYLGVVWSVWAWVSVLFWILWVLGVVGVVLFAVTRRWRFYRLGRSGALLSTVLVAILIVVSLIGALVGSVNWHAGVAPNAVGTATVTVPGSTATQTVTVTETQTVQVPEARPSGSPAATLSERQQVEKEASEWVRKIVVKFDGVKTVPAACKDVHWNVDLTKPHFYATDPNKESPGAFGPSLGKEPCEITRNLVERMYRDPMLIAAELQEHSLKKFKNESELKAYVDKLYDGPFKDRRAAAERVLNWYASHTHKLSHYNGAYLSTQAVARGGVVIPGPVTGNRASTIITSSDTSGKVVHKSRVDCGLQGFKEVVRVVERVVTPGTTTTSIVTVPGPTQTVVTPGPTVTTTVEIPTTSTPPPVTTTVTPPPVTVTRTPTPSKTTSTPKPPKTSQGQDCGLNGGPGCPPNSATRPVQETSQPSSTRTTEPPPQPTETVAPGGSSGTVTQPPSTGTPSCDPVLGCGSDHTDPPPGGIG